MGFFDWVGDFLDKGSNALAKGIRRFVVYTLLVFFLGMYVGVRLMQVGLEENLVWFFAPLALAALAYLYTEIAFVLFVMILLSALILLL